MFVVLIDLGLCVLMSLILVFKAWAIVRMLFLVITLGFSIWSVVFSLHLIRHFVTPVVWQAALIYLLWMAVHFALISLFKWGF